MIFEQIKNTEDRGVTRNSSYNKLHVRSGEVDGGRKDCCSFINGIYKEHDIYVYVFTHQLAFKHMDKSSYMTLVESYINSIGLDVTLMNKVRHYTSMNHPSYQTLVKKSDASEDDKPCFVFRINSSKYKKGINSLITHSLIRMLWEDRYDGLWDEILTLRENESLAHLDNYEILSLAYYKDVYWEYHGLFPNYKERKQIHRIMSLKSFNNRLNSTIHNRVHETCGISISEGEEYNNMSASNLDSHVRKLYKDKKYLEVYELMSYKGKVSFGNCINDENKEDWIMNGKTYDLKQSKNKRFVIVKCDDGIERKLKKDRFECYE